MDAYVVYELQPTRSRRDRDEPSGERLPAKQSLQLVGCFIAESEREACNAAAASQNRAAYYVALRANVQQARFERAEDEQLKRLSGLEPDDRERLEGQIESLRKAIEKKI